MANQACADSTSFLGVIGYRMGYGMLMGLGFGLSLRFFRLAPRSFPKTCAQFGLGFGLGASYSQIAALADAFLIGQNRRDQLFYSEMDAIKEEIELMNKLSRKQ